MSRVVEAHNADRQLLTEKYHRQRIIANFKGEILSHPELAVGFSLFWAWVWIVFQSNPLTQVVRLDSILLPAWIVPLMSYALGFFVLGSLFRLKRIVPHGRLYLLAIAACMTGGAIMMLVLSFLDYRDGIISKGATILCGFLIGCGTAGLHVEWGRVFASRGVYATIVHGIVGTLGSALLYIALHLLPASATLICAVFIPALCMWVLHKNLSLTPRLYKFSLETKLYTPWKFIITSLVQGVSFGAMWTALLLTKHDDSFMLINAASFAVAALGVFVTVLLFRMDFNHLIYQVAFLLMALSYLLLAIFKDAISLCGVLNSVGCHYMSLLMWALCVYLVINRKLSANWVFSWTTGSYILGQALGAIFSNVAITYSAIQSDSLSVLSILMVFIILVSALLMLNNNNLNVGWGMIRPRSDDSSAGPLELACNLIGSEYQLTPRERDVLLLLVKGRNRTVISKQLNLSRNTVKTHILRIYQKTNVHSQQELMTVAEKEMQFSKAERDLQTAAIV